MLVTEEEKKEAAKDEGGIKEKVMEFWGRDGGDGGDGEDGEDDDDDDEDGAGNGKGREEDPFSVSSGEEEEDVHEQEGREEEGREEQGREEQGREEEGREEAGEYPPIIITAPLMKIGRGKKTTTKLTTQTRGRSFRFLLRLHTTALEHQLPRELRPPGQDLRSRGY